MDVSIGLPNAVPGASGGELVELGDARSDAARLQPASGPIDRRRLRVATSPLDRRLAAAAAVTERIGLCTSVLLGPLRTNPTELAKQALSVHALSGGRFTLGIGLGAREDADTVRQYLEAFEAAGCGGAILFPSSSDPDQVDLPLTPPGSSPEGRGAGWRTTCRSSSSPRRGSWRRGWRSTTPRRGRVDEDRQEGLGHRDRHVRRGARRGPVLRLDRRPEGGARRATGSCSASRRGEARSKWSRSTAEGRAADRRRSGCEPAGLREVERRRPMAAGTPPTPASARPRCPTTCRRRSTPTLPRPRSSPRSTAPTATRSSTACRTPRSRRPGRKGAEVRRDAGAGGEDPRLAKAARALFSPTPACSR